MPNKRFNDFKEIRKEINVETDREVGKDGISSTPINLKIYSPDVLDLTLVDLPGMTRMPVGNQPKDIERRVEKMIIEYIENENCLILAVTAANQGLDKTTSHLILISFEYISFFQQIWRLLMH